MCRLRIDRYRRRKGLAPTTHHDPLVSVPGPKPTVTYDITLDDLGKPLSQLGAPAVTEPKRYKPGQVPQAPASTPPQAPRPPQGQRMPGRPQPPTPMHMTLQGALQVEVPFGKYIGSTLEDLTGDDEGLSYLWWLANEAEVRSNRFAEAIAAVYDVYSSECEAARKGQWDRLER